MRYFIPAIVATLTVFAAQAADVVDQRYIDQMTRGGNVSIKQAAQSIYNTGENDTEVLDVAAEVLLQRSATAGKNDIDTLAWVARALGNSGNARYYSALQEVANGDAHRKLRKYAKNAMKAVGQSDVDQYQKGMVDLVALRTASQQAAADSELSPGKVSPEGSGKSGIDIIREGMSMEEVYALVGEPTATASHQTGKAWVPFNFGAKDLARTDMLYKGQGRVVLSHDGYSSTSHVVEVIIDPDESGFP